MLPLLDFVVMTVSVTQNRLDPSAKGKITFYGKIPRLLRKREKDENGNITLQKFINFYDIFFI